MKRIIALLSLSLILPMANVYADGVETIQKQANLALETLYETIPGSKAIADQSTAVLVFPEIIKGGLVIGGQYGDGVLLKEEDPIGYYRSFAASYGLQAGIQKFGYALFFMSQDDLEYLDRSDGWELGVGPSLVVLDEGAATSVSTTTMKDGVYAFIFSQKGLMAGIGIEGSKITPIVPE